MKLVKKVTLAVAAVAVAIGFSVSAQAKEWRGLEYPCGGLPEYRRHG